MIPNIIGAIIGGIGYLCGSLITRRLLLSHTYEVEAANTELRERLATVQGELNAANERYNARVKRALDGAKAGVKTKKENREKAGASPVRIVLPVAQAEGVRT